MGRARNQNGAVSVSGFDTVMGARRGDRPQSPQEDRTFVELISEMNVIGVNNTEPGAQLLLQAAVHGTPLSWGATDRAQAASAAAQLQESITELEGLRLQGQRADLGTPPESFFDDEQKQELARIQRLQQVLTSGDGDMPEFQQTLQRVVDDAPDGAAASLLAQRMLDHLDAAAWAQTSAPAVEK